MELTLQASLLWSSPSSPCIEAEKHLNSPVHPHRQPCTCRCVRPARKSARRRLHWRLVAARGATSHRVAVPRWVSRHRKTNHRGPRRSDWASHPFSPPPTRGLTCLRHLACRRFPRVAACAYALVCWKGRSARSYEIDRDVRHHIDRRRDARARKPVHVDLRLGADPDVPEERTVLALVSDAGKLMALASFARRNASHRRGGGADGRPSFLNTSGLTSMTDSRLSITTTWAR